VRPGKSRRRAEISVSSQPDEAMLD
jgi:hypothetical protein